jgi:hypothetical protein
VWSGSGVYSDCPHCVVQADLNTLPTGHYNSPLLDMAFKVSCLPYVLLLLLLPKPYCWRR